MNGQEKLCCTLLFFYMKPLKHITVKWGLGGITVWFCTKIMSFKLCVFASGVFQIFLMMMRFASKCIYDLFKFMFNLKLQFFLAKNEFLVLWLSLSETLLLTCVAKLSGEQCSFFMFKTIAHALHRQPTISDTVVFL